MEDPRGCEYTEVNQSGGEVGSRQGVKQTDEEEWNDVLQVVVVTPAGF